MNIGFTYEKLEKFNSALTYYSKSLIILYRLEDYRNISVCLNNMEIFIMLKASLTKLLILLKKVWQLAENLILNLESNHPLFL